MSAYRGLCNLVDDHLGRVLGTLEALGLDENTVVVFLSDHGEMMGARRLVGKGVMFEDAMRVPLVIRVPGQRVGRRVDGPVSLVDLVPTLLELMGVDGWEGLHGRSLAGAVEGGALEPGDVHVHWNEPEREPPADPPGWMVELAGDVRSLHEAQQDRLRSIITPEGWVLTLSVPCGDHELFHLPSDPDQRVNLIRRAEHQPVVAELTERIRRHQQRTGDPHPLPTRLPAARLG